MGINFFNDPGAAFCTRCPQDSCREQGLQSFKPLMNVKIIAQPPMRGNVETEKLQVRRIERCAVIENTVLLSFEMHFKLFDQASVVSSNNSPDYLGIRGKGGSERGVGVERCGGLSVNLFTYPEDL